MSYSAKRYQGKVLEISLEEALFEEGYSYVRGMLEDVFSEPKYKSWELTQEEINYILRARESNSLDEIMSTMPKKSRGANWMAKQVYYRHWQSEFNIKDLCCKWSAVKELRVWEACNRELCKRLDVSYGKLMHLGIRFAWQADRFCKLYEQVYNPKRPWGSCYQVSQQKVKAMALTHNYNRLPLWVKKIMLDSQYIQADGDARIGNIWRLKNCAKAWKHAPFLPKNIAEKVGKLSLKARMLSKLAWAIATNDFPFHALYDAHSCNWESCNEKVYCRAELVNRFWQQLNRLMSCSYIEVISVFVYISAFYEADRYTEVVFGLPHKMFNTLRDYLEDSEIIEQYMKATGLDKSPEYQHYLEQKEIAKLQEIAATELKTRKSKICCSCKFYSGEIALGCAVNPLFMESSEVEQCLDWEQK